MSYYNEIMPEIGLTDDQVSKIAVRAFLGKGPDTESLLGFKPSSADSSTRSSGGPSSDVDALNFEK